MRGESPGLHPTIDDQRAVCACAVPFQAGQVVLAALACPANICRRPSRPPEKLCHDSLTLGFGGAAIRGLTAQEPMQILYAAMRAGRASANEQVVLPRVRTLRSTRSAWLACSARTHLPEPSCNDTLLPATEEACWAAKVGKHKVKVVKPDGGFVHERNDP